MSYPHGQTYSWRRIACSQLTLLCYFSFLGFLLACYFFSVFPLLASLALVAFMLSGGQMGSTWLWTRGLWEFEGSCRWGLLVTWKLLLPPRWGLATLVNPPRWGLLLTWKLLVPVAQLETVVNPLVGACCSPGNCCYSPSWGLKTVVSPSLGLETVVNPLVGDRRISRMYQTKRAVTPFHPCRAVARF